MKNLKTRYKRLSRSITICGTISVIAFIAILGIANSLEYDILTVKESIVYSLVALSTIGIFLPACNKLMDVREEVHEKIVRLSQSR